jgi:hypothetical protein
MPIQKFILWAYHVSLEQITASRATEHHSQVRVGTNVGRDGSVGIATGWTVRGSNPGEGEIFGTCTDRP